MAKTVLIRFYNPSDVGCEFATEKEQRESCFKVAYYASEAAALWAYAETPCAWSTLVDDSSNINAFINEAWERIKDGDIEWLENNFTQTLC